MGHASIEHSIKFSPGGGLVWGSTAHLVGWVTGTSPVPKALAQIHKVFHTG